ncbi:MAG TPA: SgcJ/EcaC family oxidoreductase [Streptosporangiaceae bacterium]|nr:SgcJ/EcaC family oxidoreductase [Streptosporangiaceae bacterium]
MAETKVSQRAGGAQGPSEADVAAAQKVMQRIVDAWAAHNGDAFAEVFTPDASLILPGDVYLKNREEIRQYMTKGFAGPYRGTQVTGVPVNVRLLRPDVALLLTDGGVLAPGETEVAPERAVRAAWLLAKQNGDWLITAYQNTPKSA